MRIITGFFCLFYVAVLHAAYLKAADILQMASDAPAMRLLYGKDKNQYAELRVPNQQAWHPVVVLIHGGCWLSTFADANIMAPLASALTEAGFATWNIEYRRVDQAGGGWPGTFRDVGQAVDALRLVPERYHLDLNRVVLLGHSAGGYLALWAAGRHKLSRDSILYTPNPLLVRGVIDLAGPPDLKSFSTLQESVCGQKIIQRMLGGLPSEKPAVYEQASPAELLPLHIKQILMLGQYDKDVPLKLIEPYVIKARALGDQVSLQLVPKIGHFELISPTSTARPLIVQAVDALLKDTDVRNIKEY